MSNLNENESKQIEYICCFISHKVYVYYNCCVGSGAGKGSIVPLYDNIVRLQPQKKGLDPVGPL